MCISNTARRRTSITKLPSSTLSALVSGKIASDFVPPVSSSAENFRATIQTAPDPAHKIQWTSTGAASAPAPKPQPRPAIDATGVNNYHDHAGDQPDNSKHIARGGVTTPFPLKLHELLDEIEADGLAHVISWQPHGRCFVVHKPKEFVNSVMPKYFKQSKFASFQRQLNLYGFNRLTTGLDRGGYYHEYFLRGMTFLSHKIQRKRVKGTGVRTASCPETEPNFYRMRPVQGPHNPPVIANSFVPIKIPQRSPPFASAAPTVIEHIVHQPCIDNSNLYQYLVSVNKGQVAAPPVPQSMFSNPAAAIKSEETKQYVRQVTPPNIFPPSDQKKPPNEEDEEVKDDKETPCQLEDDGDMDDFFKNIDLAFELDEEQMDCLFDDTSFGYLLEKAVDQM